MSIIAVVVTYNRCAMLRKCLSHLKAQTYSCDILVVDNASDDGTRDWITAYQEENSCVYCCHLDTNTGGAGGFNYGMRWALEAGYEYVWVMDDDTLPEPDALEKLMKADRVLEGNYGWLSSVTLWIDGNECKMNRQKLIKGFSENSPLLMRGLVQAKQATFVSLFLRSETICCFGLPIKEFFIWSDDIEFTRRIAVRGKRQSYVVQNSRVIHDMKNNNGSSLATDDAERIERYHYAFRNENYLYRKENIRGCLYYIAKCVFNAIKILVFAKDHRLLRLGVIGKEFFLGLIFNPKVEYINTSLKDMEG